MSGVERRHRVVLAGASTRALAESAARAGYWVWAVDAFGDLDQEAFAETLALTPARGLSYSATAAARAARPLAAPAAAYAGGFENWPAAVRMLAQGRTLWGNPPQVLARARNPLLVSRRLGARGFVVPETRGSVPADAGLADAGRGRRSWLVKPRRSGGGQGVTRWRPGEPLPAGHYLQQRIEGVPGSVVFVADGRRAVTLGVSRQLVGERHFGAAGFRYCGSLLGVGDVALFGRDAAIRATAAALAQAATEEFGLVGLNGIDFIARAGVPVPIEINPRYTASMELVERASGVSMFETHVRACRGLLPRAPFPGRGPAVHGKAVVFARRAVRVAGVRRWLRDGAVRDVPHPGERIARGRPVCTVLARAASADGCHAALRRRAAAIYRQLAAAAPAGRAR